MKNHLHGRSLDEAMAMIHMIISDALYNEEYVTRCSNGPFFVRTDNGKLLRESEISPKGSPENYVVWDTAGDQPQAITPHTDGPTGISPALSGTYEVAGIACRLVFQELAALANGHPPEGVGEKRGVSSETIKSLVREYAREKPGAILVGFGLRYMNSGSAYRAIHTLGALTGNISVLVGGVVCGQCSNGQLNGVHIRMNDFPIVFPTQSFATGTPNAQVMHVRGHSIKGLYDAGNSAALFKTGAGYPSGLADMRGVDWGYIAAHKDNEGLCCVSANRKEVDQGLFMRN